MAIKQEKAIVKTSEPKTAKEAPKAKAPHDLRRISITSTYKYILLKVGYSIGLGVLRLSVGRL